MRPIFDIPSQTKTIHQGFWLMLSKIGDNIDGNHLARGIGGIFHRLHRRPHQTTPSASSHRSECVRGCASVFVNKTNRTGNGGNKLLFCPSWISSQGIYLLLVVVLLQREMRQGGQDGTPIIPHDQYIYPQAMRNDYVADGG